ncbi:MAG: type II toxin-antitoxin system VapC family toxin [Geminicoccales bacterium]
MGGVDALAGKVVDLDANVFVYAVEGFAEHQGFIDELFRSIDSGHVSAVTSELTLAEVLIKPLETRRHDVAAVYEELLQSSEHLNVVPIDRAILISAARHRADLGVKLPDAIHVATAIAVGCDVLLSNDQKLRVPDEIGLRALG